MELSLGRCFLLAARPFGAVVIETLHFRNQGSKTSGAMGTVPRYLTETCLGVQDCYPVLAYLYAVLTVCESIARTNAKAS